MLRTPALLPTHPLRLTPHSKAKLDGVAQKAVHITDADDLTEEALQDIF